MATSGVCVLLSHSLRPNRFRLPRLLLPAARRQPRHPLLVRPQRRLRAPDTARRGGIILLRLLAALPLDRRLQEHRGEREVHLHHRLVRPRQDQTAQVNFQLSCHWS